MNRFKGRSKLAITFILAVHLMAAGKATEPKGTTGFSAQYAVQSKGRTVATLIFDHEVGKLSSRYLVHEGMASEAQHLRFYTPKKASTLNTAGYIESLSWDPFQYRLFWLDTDKDKVEKSVLDLLADDLKNKNLIVDGDDLPRYQFEAMPITNLEWLLYQTMDRQTAYQEPLLLFEHHNQKALMVRLDAGEETPVPWQRSTCTARQWTCAVINKSGSFYQPIFDIWTDARGIPLVVQSRNGGWRLELTYFGNTRPVAEYNLTKSIHALVGDKLKTPLKGEFDPATLQNQRPVWQAKEKTYRLKIRHQPRFLTPSDQLIECRNRWIRKTLNLKAPFTWRPAEVVQFKETPNGWVFSVDKEAARKRATSLNSHNRLETKTLDEGAVLDYFHQHYQAFTFALVAKPDSADQNPNEGQPNKQLRVVAKPGITDHIARPTLEQGLLAFLEKHHKPKGLFTLAHINFHPGINQSGPKIGVQVRTTPMIAEETIKKQAALMILNLITPSNNQVAAQKIVSQKLIGDETHWTWRITHDQLDPVCVDTLRREHTQNIAAELERQAGITATAKAEKNVFWLEIATTVTYEATLNHAFAALLQQYPALKLWPAQERFQSDPQTVTYVVVKGIQDAVIDCAR